jgi:hypothetical protein
MKHSPALAVEMKIVILRSRRFSAGRKDLNRNYGLSDFERTNVAFAQRQIFGSGV